MRRQRHLSPVIRALSAGLGAVCCLLNLGVSEFRTQVHAFFSRLIQRVSPKSAAQAEAEVSVTQKFLENFSGDQASEGSEGKWGPPAHSCGPGQ